MSDLRMKVLEGLKIGDTITTSRCFSEELTNQFADITRDYNPAHFDKRFSNALKLDGEICHGLLVAGMLTEIGGQLGCLVSQLNLNFKYPVYFGDTITCCLKITDIKDRRIAKTEATFSNQDGNVVLEAESIGILPNEPAKKAIRSMIDEGDPTAIDRGECKHSIHGKFTI